MRSLHACLIVGLLASTAAAAPEARLEFGAPAQFEAKASVTDLEWALLVFHDQDSSFDVEWSGSGAIINHTQGELRLEDSEYVSRGKLPVFLPAQSQDADGPLEASLRFTKPWGSLLVVAQSLQLSVDGNGSLERVEAGSTMDEHFTRYVPKWTFRVSQHNIPADGAALNLYAEQGAPFFLNATGVRVLEWHNATTDCPAFCPDGGAYVPAGPNPAASAASTWQRTFMETRFPDGSLSGQGRSYMMLAGGRVLDAELDGWMRLPRAQLIGTCDGGRCPDPEGRTFRADGLLHLDGLQPVPDSEDRLSTGYMARLSSATFDESAVQFSTAEGVAVGVAAVVGVGLLVKLLLALFARNLRPILEHPRTKALLESIIANPGQSLSDLQNRFGWGWGALRYHLRRLQEHGMIMAQGHRQTIRFFENHGRYNDTWRGVVVLQKQDARELHQWILANPDANQSAVVQHAQQAWAWKRGKTLRVLGLLEEARLIHAQRQGRTMHYTALLPTPQATSFKGVV